MWGKDNGNYGVGKWGHETWKWTAHFDHFETRLFNSAIFVANEHIGCLAIRTGLKVMMENSVKGGFLGNICWLKTRPVRVNTGRFNSMISRN